MTPGPSRLPEGSIVAYLPERERGGQVSGRECLVQNPKPAYALVAKANSVRSGRISTCFSLPNDLQNLTITFLFQFANLLSTTCVTATWIQSIVLHSLSWAWNSSTHRGSITEGVFLPFLYIPGGGCNAPEERYTEFFREDIFCLQNVSTTEQFLGALQNTDVDYIQLAGNLSFPLNTKGVLLYNRTVQISGTGNQTGSVNLDFGISEAVVVIGQGSSVTWSDLTLKRSTPLPQPSSSITRFHTAGMIMWPAIVQLDGSELLYEHSYLETPANQKDAVAYTKWAAQILIAFNPMVVDDTTLYFDGFISQTLPLYDADTNLIVGSTVLDNLDMTLKFTPQSTPQGARMECPSSKWWSWGVFWVGAAAAFVFSGLLALVASVTVRLQRRRTQRFIQFRDDSFRISEDHSKASVAHL